MLPPRLSERPSFGQRDSYRDVLTEGYAQGRLNDAEFARRSQVAQDATTLGRLEELIADLPRGDLPVPVDPSRSAGSGSTTDRTGASAPRKLLVASAAVVVGVLGGFVAGSATAGARQADDRTSTAAEAGEAIDYAAGDAARAEGHLGVGTVARVLAHAAEYDEVSRVYLYGTSGYIDVPTASGTTYDTVSIREDGSVSTEPGGTYDDASDALFDPAEVDPSVLAAMVLAAPDASTETMESAGQPAQTLDVFAPTGEYTEYAGVPRGTPIVRVTLAMDEYNSGGGSITWAADGQTILQVTE